MNKIDLVRKELKKLANPKKAKVLRRFFKTGKGEYGEGDVFLGITVPQSRKIAIKFRSLKFADISNLLKSKIHEERLIALLILVENFNTGDEKTQKRVYDFYLKNTKYINNWDLVDLSADKIVGGYLSGRGPAAKGALVAHENFPDRSSRDLYSSTKEFKMRSGENFVSSPRSILIKLAKSKNIWEKRISMIATYYFIKNGEFDSTLRIAEILLQDKHDLIQKAVGWMLREVGNRDLKTEIKFLNNHYKKMPRTMLRYAIEKFPEELRRFYLLRSKL